MNLTQRLLLGAAVAMGGLVVAVVAVAGGRLHARLATEKTEELFRSARLVGSMWTADVDADSLADAAGRALGYRVTLVDTSGVVVGDSEFESGALARLENHAARPEIAGARRDGEGVDTRTSASAGWATIYGAVRHPLGAVRLGIETASFETIVGGARRDVVVASLVGLLAALVLAWLFARSVSRPVTELRDVARRLAGGELSARPPLSAPAEVGDLAAAIHRMAEQLAARMEELREDDALMNALFETVNEGVLAISERAEVVRINDRGRDYLRVQAPVPFPAELLPRHAAVRQAVQTALGGRGSDPTELQLGADTLAISAQPLVGGGAVVTLFDLTPLRKLEVVRRDFVANVSHELKTPLTVVNGFAETLLDPALSDEERRRFSETILSNASRMLRIVDDLLDLSRIESGKWVPDRRRVPLGELVGEVFSSLSADARSRGLNLVNGVNGQLEVTADVTALRQILANLVANAVRHTDQGTVTVAATAEGDGVRVDVSDTGSGIAAEHLPRIFERFYRVDQARSRAEGGTGLGLAIVKHLAEAHGGRVAASSTVGRGTTVTVWLPD